MRKSAIKALLDSSGECQSDLSNDCGEHKGSGHDKDADQDHLPALFYEGVDLVADGDSCVSAYHGERSGEVNLSGRSNDKLTARRNRGSS